MNLFEKMRDQCIFGEMENRVLDEVEAHDTAVFNQLKKYDIPNRLIDEIADLNCDYERRGFNWGFAMGLRFIADLREMTPQEIRKL